MITASGTSTDEARWPALVLAAPRGFREIAWHLGIVAALTAALALKGSWLVLPWVAIVCWVLSPTPRLLARVSATYLVIGLVVAWRLSPRGLVDHLNAACLWAEPFKATNLDIFIHFLLLLAMGAAVVALLLGYDRRRVNRRIVDHRVWERQVRRRRQLMRRWAWGRQLPEVMP